MYIINSYFLFLFFFYEFINKKLHTPLTWPNLTLSVAASSSRLKPQCSAFSGFSNPAFLFHPFGPHLPVFDLFLLNVSRIPVASGALQHQTPPRIINIWTLSPFWESWLSCLWHNLKPEQITSEAIESLCRKKKRESKNVALTYTRMVHYTVCSNMFAFL